jgi:protein-tyrosine-phosphatase
MMERRRVGPVVDRNAPREKAKTTRHVLFLCLRNRVRSVFAEFFIREMLKRESEALAENIIVFSAGFYPEEVKAFLNEAKVSPPVPFYGIDMSGVARELMREKGMAVPDVWESKALTPEMVEIADLIVVALSPQKGELSLLYPEHGRKVVTLREMAQSEEFVVFESFSDIPIEGDVWGYWEGNPSYVAKTILEVENFLIMAYPRIIERLGLHIERQRIAI